MKNIWIFNHHALTPEMSGGTRHYDFAKELVQRGYKVSIFASSFHYARHEELKQYSNTFYKQENIDGIEFIWIKTRPYKGNGISRVLNMLDYMLKVQKIQLSTSPDVIIGSSVHLFAVYAAYKISKQYQVPFVMEVRDIWPQTLIDMGMSRWHPFVLLLGVLEKYLYSKADKIISNLPYAYKHIQKFGIKKEDIIWISNGVDIHRSDKVEAYRFEKNKFHITYAGSIGLANQLDVLIKAAALLENNSRVVVHIIGEGPLRKSLEMNKTSNVVFHGLVPKKQAISMIKGSDVLFFPLADSPVFKFGISSNKLFDYLAAKKPILFASNSMNNPIEDAKAGISVKAGDADAVAKAIESFMELSEKEMALFGANGSSYVSRNFSISFLVTKLEDCLTSLVYNSSKNEKK